MECTLMLVAYGLGSRFRRDRFSPVKNGFPKPQGGLWTSPSDSTYGWKQWAEENSFGDLTSSFAIEFRGRVCKIDSAKDLSDIPWFDPIPGKMLSIGSPDVEALAKAGIDAVWLTDEGEQSTRFSEGRSLYGWDCETVYVLNPDCVTPK